MLSGQLQSDVLTATSSSTRNQETQTDLWADTSTYRGWLWACSQESISVSSLQNAGLHTRGSEKRGVPAFWWQRGPTKGRKLKIIASIATCFIFNSWILENRFLFKFLSNVMKEHLLFYSPCADLHRGWAAEAAQKSMKPIVNQGSELIER